MSVQIYSGNTVAQIIAKTQQIMLVDANGNSLDFPVGASGIGDVVGPASSTTNAVAIYADTTGQTIANSAVIINPAGTLNANTVSGTTISGNTINALTSLQISGTDIGNTFVYKAGDTMTGKLHFAAAQGIVLDGSAGGKAQFIDGAISADSVSSIGNGVTINDTNGNGGIVNVTVAGNMSGNPGIVTILANNGQLTPGIIKLQGGDVNNFIEISGAALIPVGTANVGSAAKPFANVFATNFIGTTLNMNVLSGTTISGGTIYEAGIQVPNAITTVNNLTGNLTAGTITVSGSLIPTFTSVFSNLVSGTTFSGTALSLIGNPATITSDGGAAGLTINAKNGAGSGGLAFTSLYANFSNTIFSNGGLTGGTNSVSTALNLSGTVINLNNNVVANGVINAPVLSGTTISGNNIVASSIKATTSFTGNTITSTGDMLINPIVGNLILLPATFVLVSGNAPFYANVISGTTISGNAITAPNITATTEIFSNVVSGTTISGNAFWSGGQHVIPTRNLTFLMDNGSTVIASGSQGYMQIPYACNITAWSLLGNVSGAMAMDVLRTTYANWNTESGLSYPTNSICFTDQPKIAATTSKNQNTSVTVWSGISAGDILEFTVSGVTTNITRASLNLTVIPV